MSRMYPKPFQTAPTSLLDSVQDAVRDQSMVKNVGLNERGEVVVIDNHDALTLTERDLYDATAEWAAQVLEHREPDTPADHVLAALDIRAERWEFLTLSIETVVEILTTCVEAKRPF